MELNDDRKGMTSASNAHADSLCQGRHLAQLGFPDEQSADAKFGTEIHEALASADPAKLNSEQLSIYESCVEIRDKIVADVFGPDAPKATPIKERRLWCRVDEKLMHSGKPDFVVRVGTRGLILEFKTLPSDVPGSAKNLQLRDQAVLASGKLILKEVHVGIVQPLVTHQPEVCRYDEAHIRRAEIEMFQRVRNSNNPAAPRTAGEAQCKFCKARHSCPERARLLEVSTPVAVSSLAGVAVADWTPAQRSLFCERLPMAAKWLEECKNQLKAQLEADPTSIPGWALEPGSIKTPIVKPEELHARFLAAGGTVEQFLSCVDIGKGDLKKAVREATKLKGKALDAKLRELTDGLTENKPDAPSLVRRDPLP